MTDNAIYTLGDAAPCKVKYQYRYADGYTIVGLDGEEIHRFHGELATTTLGQVMLALEESVGQGCEFGSHVALTQPNSPVVAVWQAAFSARIEKTAIPFLPEIDEAKQLDVEALLEEGRRDKELAFPPFGRIMGDNDDD